MSELGRVIDPTLLDACDRGRVRLRVEVPPAWLSEGADVELTAPALLVCAGCDGGGCDGCGRSGALRAPADAVARTLHVRLPRLPARREFVLRIPQPFGPEHPVAQLLLEVRAGCPAAGASPGVRRIAQSAATLPSKPPPAPTPTPSGARGVPERAVSRRHRSRRTLSRCRRRQRTSTPWRHLPLLLAWLALLTALFALAR